ncbi:MAG: preprotein translocase subunit SecG [Rhodobacteraceae bacterium]|nr:preprotein translocase subunit SecG [Paracoccaceae bacterium]MYG42344.1 preprotein translocase subunit SecG [Paracoccaceae bacterium]MYJ87510.1 preprotein translocase subunit SecG [Paracoccaceae bacterium]
MSNIVLVVHLILALILIGIVLLQRSEGGGLGIGGGGNMLSGRGSITGLGKLTWLFAVLFLVTSLSLTILTASDQSRESVVERLGIDSGDGNQTLQLDPDELIPPSGTDEPALPPKTE